MYLFDWISDFWYLNSNWIVACLCLSIIALGVWVGIYGKTFPPPPPDVFEECVQGYKMIKINRSGWIYKLDNEKQVHC